MKKRSVKIAVIDSGINTFHSHISNVSGGISISVSEDGYLHYSPDFQDYLGHGTAVAAAILEEIPDCELYAIRIFERQLKTYPTVLCAGLEWAIDQNVDIINLSLAFQTCHDELKRLCSLAKKSGISIVSAYDEKQNLLYPGRFEESVFAVSAGTINENEFLYIGKNRYEACGKPRELKLTKDMSNLFGHSFAAARFSGFLAKQLLQIERN
ncbi:S8 family serine peptidase [Schinkia sp. CFF1]